MFEKTLSDLVKGLRSNKRREAEYVSKCIAEIKEMTARSLHSAPTPPALVFCGACSSSLLLRE
ncbi:hypothetical protein T484DRAFT_1834699 [Baffinella frigidus]|nr:hypothetical protein T484DRAFT_1834699 [Cryptophyta sp. CCMP2293]